MLFSGIFLTGFGSSYYHLNPNDNTLFWDRLPMTFCFAAILAAVVEERVEFKGGRDAPKAAACDRSFQSPPVALDG